LQAEHLTAVKIRLKKGFTVIPEMQQNNYQKNAGPNEPAPLFKTLL
jgi:hypothetical protein